LTEVDGVPLARLVGEIDLAVAPVVEARLLGLLSQHNRGLIVDLSEVRYLDSSIVRVLFVVADRFAATGRELHVVVPRGSRLVRLVSIIQLDAVVAVHDDLSAATRSVRGSGFRSGDDFP
jgi:anti-anti-sigma factor